MLEPDHSKQGMATINCDMGEAFGLYRMGDDEVLMPLISVANVACGFHASDFNHMRRTVRLAKEQGVKVGAHPSLPDLQGFGRREMKMPREELANCIIYQVGALKGFLEAEGMTLNHIKPHGSLYGMAAREEAVAHAICDAALGAKAFFDGHKVGHDIALLVPPSGRSAYRPSFNASRTARATSTAFGVSECTQIESARTATSLPLTLEVFPSAIARRQRDAARAGSTARCSRVMISRPSSA